MVEELTGEELQGTAERTGVSPLRLLGAPARVLVLPRSTFARLAGDYATAWTTAIGLLVVAGATKAAIALWLTLSAHQGTRVLVAVGVRYGADLVLPVAFALSAAGALLVAQRLWRGDARFGRLVSCASLALAPLALRDILQGVYMALTRKALLNPGLSALLAPPPRSVAGRAACALLAQVDAFMLWALVLLALGVGVTAGRGRFRAALTACGIALLAAALGALPSFAIASLLFG